MQLSLLYPELCLLFIACVVLMTGVFVKSGAPKIVYSMTQVGLIAALFLLFYVPMGSSDFSALIIADRLSQALKACILLAVIFSFRYAKHYNSAHALPAAEFYVLGLLSTIGMLLLVSTTNLMMLFLGLELMALPIYTLTAIMQGKMRSVEAGMKYFVIGAVASGLLLYGFSLFYGAAQSLELSKIAAAISAASPSMRLAFYFGLVFVVIGIAFKLGAAPFHAWVPDIYDGAPNSVTLFISAAPKIAAFGFAARFFMDIVPQLHMHLQFALIVIAMLSIALGNIAGIVQNNIKRLLAISCWDWLVALHVGIPPLSFMSSHTH